MIPQPCVLIVEDTDSIREVYSLILAAKGFRVILAENGLEGVRMARAERPDAILMDFSMPVMNGLEAALELKRSPETESIPVLFHSAEESHFLARVTRAADAFGYVQKPAELQVVLQALQDAIERSRVSAADREDPEIAGAGSLSR